MKTLRIVLLQITLLILIFACQAQHSGWMYGRWETDLETTQRANQELRSAFDDPHVARIIKNLEDTPPVELTQREVIIGSENPSRFTYQTLKVTEEAFHAQMPGNISFILYKDQHGIYRENTGYISVEGQRTGYTVKQYLKSMAIQPIPEPAH